MQKQKQRKKNSFRLHLNCLQNTIFIINQNEFRLNNFHIVLLLFFDRNVDSLYCMSMLN